MSDQVSWLLELAVKPGELESFKALMAEMVESTQGEAGVLIYEWSISDDGSAIHIAERFADSAAVVAHLTGFAERFAQRFLAAVDPTGLVVYGAPNDEAKEALTALGPTYMAPLGGFAR
jgi:quinol monooxygenase YgiN